jgi:DNA-binding transcriptional ArsR family regulator
MPEGAPLPNTHPRTVKQHHVPRTDLRCAPCPLHSAELIREDLGLSPELLASWALRRAHRGGVTKSGDQYVDYSRLTLSYLTRTLDELTEAGLLALAEEGPWGLRRVSLTETGHAQYAQLAATPRRVTLSVPEPQFPPKTPAGRRSSCPDPPYCSWRPAGSRQRHGRRSPPRGLTPIRGRASLRSPAGPRLQRATPRRSAPRGQPATTMPTPAPQ